MVCAQMICGRKGGRVPCWDKTFDVNGMVLKIWRENIQQMSQLLERSLPVTRSLRSTVLLWNWVENDETAVIRVDL